MRSAPTTPIQENRPPPRRTVSVSGMDLTALDGEAFGPHPMRICIANVADFVGVTSDDPERWVGAAPPGFAAAALFMVAPDLLSQLTGRSVIHGEQTFTWHKPLGMESEVQVTGSVTKVRDRAGTHFVGFDVEVVGDDGPVASGSSLFLVTDDTTVGLVDPRVEPPPLDRGGPGDGQVSMSRADLVAYAAATRDWNPIHWDHDAAVAAGLPGVVVHGLAQAAWALGAASRLMTGDSPLTDARIRFRNPLPPATPVDVLVDEAEGAALVSVTDANTEYLSARVGLAG